MKKQIKKLNTTIGNYWKVITLVAESTAAVLLIRAALGLTTDLPKIALAIAGSILLVNILVKLYRLSK